MLDTILDMLYKMVAIINDHDRVSGEMAAFELQATKWAVLHKTDLVNKFLDEIALRKQEKEALDKICEDVFNCTVSQLRNKIVDIRVSIEQYEELVVETAKAAQAFKLIQSSDIFENELRDLGQRGVAEFLRELNLSEQRAELALGRIHEIAVSSTKIPSEEEINE